MSSDLVRALSIVLIVAVAGCTSILATCKNVTQLQEIQIPYNELESYEVREPYVIYLKHEVVESNITRVKQDNATLARATVKLRNTDAEEGWFTVIYEFSDGTLANSRQLIRAGETGIFTFVDTAGADVSGAVTFTQSDPVTKYNVKVNYRAVTKYRTETENVTKEVCK